jgi:hypothetical protein
LGASHTVADKKLVREDTSKTTRIKPASSASDFKYPVQDNGLIQMSLPFQ